MLPRPVVIGVNGGSAGHALDRAAAEEWLSQVARAAARDAGGVPSELLGDYLTLLADAAITGRKPRSAELEAVGRLGRRAAELGVSAGSAVQLYLSAARRLWGGLPMVIRARDSGAVRAATDAVLYVVDAAVASLAEGYTEARRQLVRWEETQRREFIEDLLRGDADVGRLVERAEPFGLDMARPHQVALAAPTGRLEHAEAAIGSLEHAVVNRVGDRDVLVATKDGRIIVVAPADAEMAAAAGTPAPPTTLGEFMLTELNRSPRGRPWRIAVGRPYPGSYGIPRSYEEAREGLAMAARLRLSTSVIHAEQLLIYRVLLRDQPAITDLIHSVLGPLVRARGGAQPLLATLEAYFDSGGVTEAARRLHLSVRGVSYRLDRVRALTGYDPTNPAQRFTLQAAVLGARLLGWPEQDPPPGAHRDHGDGSPASHS